jgi:hypothetical protein
MQNSAKHNITTKIASALLLVAVWIGACSSPANTLPTSTGTPQNTIQDVSNQNDLIKREERAVTDSPISVISNSGARSVAALPIPKSGAATATGILYDKATGLPITNRTVLLAPVQDGKAFFIDTASSPTVQSDDFGRFVFSDIEARTYAIIIGDPFGTYTIAPDLKIENKVRVWSVEVNKINDIGDLIVDWTLIKN